MKKRFALVTIAMLVFILTMAVTALAEDSVLETLTIKGDGVSRELTFSLDELKALQEGNIQATYSVTNNFPTNRIIYRQGILLDYLLKQTGMKDSAMQLKFISSDGYSRTFTRQELLNDLRYYFSDGAAPVKVPVIIALADSTKGFAFLTDIEPSLTMGQRVLEEQTNPWFVKYLQTIEVSTAQPDQWSPVAFSKAPGPNGVTITLQHPNFDAVKIYYTTDGSNPTINSNVYNVSASYYQPQLNQPIVVSSDTEIRAIAIGAGKTDSAVSSTAVVFNGVGFSDLGSFGWARLAIEDLARKKIINGMGESRFAPQEGLTRAQFAKMVVLALEETPLTGGSSRFSDIKTGDWYYGYVEKAAALGMIKGYPDGTFRPNNVLSRQEMLTILVQAMKANSGTETADANLPAPFTGETRISDWARTYVYQAESLGLLEHGYMVLETAQGLSFNAEMQANRAEAAFTVYRMLQQ